jgi:ferredoxin/flavodoxin---NADP+ reductase
MTFQLGTSQHPLRVAIIGSGPSGFYAAERLERESNLVVEIDMFERLPTPHGLVRGGVAPDHAKIKSVTKVYDKIAADNKFRFYGNIEFGKDITHDELMHYYHAVIYAVGAQTDRRMGISGEDLLNSHPATEFVGWYNAHPDYRDLQFDLSQERVAIIGNGNVAMDVARILASTPAELEQTDIADYALDALRHSRVREIYVLGRRGPAQAAFTNPEIKELGELADAEVLVPADEAALDDHSRAALAAENDRTAAKNVEILAKYSQQPPQGRARKLIMRFLVSPVELIGDERVEAIKLVKNELYRADDGSIRPRATDQHETIPVGLVFRSIGYKGVALAGVPFDERGGVIPNDHGRVLRAGALVVGEYVVGWIKRGPSGVIGTNKPDSVESVERLLEDMRAGVLPTPSQPNRAALEALLDLRKPSYVTYDDWLRLDALEQANGQAQGRPRLKFSRVDDMLAAVSHTHAAPEAGD